MADWIKKVRVETSIPATGEMPNGRIVCGNVPSGIYEMFISEGQHILITEGHNYGSAQAEYWSIDRSYVNDLVPPSWKSPVVGKGSCIKHESIY